jgi:hypothetical protein
LPDCGASRRRLGQRKETDPGGGREISEQMPWRAIGKMDEEELAAVYQYLTHLSGFSKHRSKSKKTRANLGRPFRGAFMNWHFNGETRLAEDSLIGGSG